MSSSVPVRLRRIPVHVDAVHRDEIRCTPSGVDLPAGNVIISRDRFPAQMREQIAPGKVFFAQANLAAEHADDVQITAIEPEWGRTDGFLHFEASPEQA